MRSNLIAIIKNHYRTYEDIRTGVPRWQEYTVSAVLPLAIFGICLAVQVRVGGAVAVGLFVVGGIFGVSMLAAMVQIARRSIDWANSSPVPSKDTSFYATYLSELVASTGYAALVFMLASVVFVVASTSSGWVGVVASSIGIAMGIHAVFVLLAIIERLFAITQAQLNRARTGMGGT